MKDDKTTRRQITHEERDMLVDLNLTKAADALGVGDGDTDGLTLEKWQAATEHVNRATALMKEPQPRLTTATKPAPID